MTSRTPQLNPTVLAYLKQGGLLRDGHFVFRSGRHSEVLLDRDRLLANPKAASHMGYALAKSFFTEKIDTVASPSIWGGGLAQWVAYFLDPRASVVYATPAPDGSRKISSNLTDMIAGRRVLLVDNVMLSGRTMERFCEAIAALGGNIVGVGTLWDGAGLTVCDHPVVGLLNVLYPTYLPKDCPSCASNPDHNNHDVEQIPY